ncbi:hypothetical protein M9M90_01050 [Phenylobacterium sp. LH3H17]|uniref:hypothetical protein n=1 Tax=Phenylobacterium sp. LH3H17 TaxID=2903901 RepID=UPI0020C995C7|nr:hypothetical protein [Phenylobacterium sp. LH3H17]UTP39792.1 hypothetical protein M9M90_01050 [Phenylobacterium sp. LH3H17]
MPDPRPSARRPVSEPTVSRRLADGTLIELVYDPVAATTSLAIGRPDGSRTLELSIDLPTGERLVPYSPTNNLIASGSVLLPCGFGPQTNTQDLVAEISAFLHRYVDLSASFGEIAPYYVLLTWVYDAFRDLPYLRFRGDYGTGKTRALLALGSLCYKSFFASGASTVSPIFHILDVFRGTLILDEADLRFSDATAQLTKILNNGNADGLPILRTMSNRHGELSPRAFKVYGPKIVAMRESFADRALESRFLTEETGAHRLRADIPIALPDAFHGEAASLRDKLLTWRFDHRDRVRVEPSRTVSGVEPRLNQTGLALLSLIEDAEVRRRLGERLVREQARWRDDRAASLEAGVLRVLLELFAGGAPEVTVSAVTVALNLRLAEDQGAPMSPKAVGAVLRARLRLRTMRMRGVYVVPRSEFGAIQVLAQRAGVAGERTDAM